jgi:pimeloyl-[acyl-carrier protein] methyl ester esterase
MAAELVLIHGWAFDAHFWETLKALMPGFKLTSLDLGFFGEARTELAEKTQPRILVGHSLGFAHGVKTYDDWDGWIAINGFARFIKTDAMIGCVEPTVLREMRQRLQSDADKTLQDFYRLIGAKPPQGTPNPQSLRRGLDELMECDVGDWLSSHKIPGLALAGKKDPLVPIFVSKELGKLARKGGLMLHEKAGHLLPQTEPVWCAQAIGNFANLYFG